MSASEPGGGRGTHYELFRGLREAGVRYVVTGAAALVLHGVPRLVPGIELDVDPDPVNLARIARLFTSWGYGEARAGAAGAGNTAIRRFRHPRAALGEIDVALPSAAGFARLRAGAATAPLVDLEIPFAGADELLARLERTGTPADQEDAASLQLLAALRSGESAGTGVDDETRREQIRKFSRWSVAARLDWLLAGARLSKGMAPEARPMTRGLTRRHWFPGR
jgi:hypothetical protein